MPERKKKTGSKSFKFVHKEVLSNGLTVLVYEMPWARSVTARLLIKAGTKYEDKKTAGTAHYLEHMIFEGSKKYPSRRELDRAAEKLGGDFTGWTDKECVMYQSKFPSEYAEFATRFLRELVFNPLMDKKAFIREKGIITAELRRNIENPGNHRWNLLRSFIWKKHIFGINTLGTFNSIKNITRQNLIDYHNKYYKPDNLILVIAGKITVSKAIKLAEKDFGNLSRKKEDYPVIPEPTFSVDKHVLIEKRDLKQTHLLLSFDTNGHGESSPLWPQLILLNKLIAYNIFHKFVYDLGYSYSASSSAWLVKDSGNIVIYMEIPLKKITDSISILVKEINKLKINNQSVQEAKASAISNLFLNLADTDEYADYIGMWELYYGEVKSPDECKKVYQSVTVKELQALRKSIFTRKNSAMVILADIPSKKEEKFDKMLVFG